MRGGHEDKTKNHHFSNAGDKLKRHIYDYVITDSGIERAFVTKLDASTDVVVYAKLPRGFLIPTPVGDCSVGDLFEYATEE